MARESEEGEVLVADGAEIALTKPLMIYAEEPEWHEYMKKEDYHCE